jgi:predicted RNA-binding protein associated with RNAse of E/G family
MNVPPSPDISQGPGGERTYPRKMATDTADVARFQPGAAIALRELWNGKVWYARAATVVLDDDLTMLFVHAHAHAKEPVRPDGVALRIPTDVWTLRDVDHGSTWNLSFAFPERSYAVILGFEPTGELREYYVNLQTPLARSDVGFDTVDHLLDVRIRADRSSWAWKDEDELDEAVAEGLFTAEDAASFRRWGERAVEHVVRREPPFDRDWSSWRPDRSWTAPVLPPGWDVVNG